MLAAPVYYLNAFGAFADAGGGTNPVTIPQAAAVDGSVSYYGGYTDPYEYNLLTNPAALPVTRPAMNQLFYDLTANVQEYQNYGAPQWYSGATVPGSAAGYPIFARVYYSGAVYENQVALNTATPGAALSNWLQISGASDGIQSGMIMEYASPIAPAGYLACDGGSYLRSGVGSYPNLFAAVTFSETGNATSTSSAQVTGLTNATTRMYPGMYIESANFPVNTYIASITNSTTIVMSANASTAGSAPILFFPWNSSGNLPADSSHFNVPNLIGKVSADAGGTLLGNPTSTDAVGQTTGAASVMLTNANLPTSIGGTTELMASSGGGTPVLIANSSGSYTLGNSSGGQATSLVQPTTITFKIIKT